MTTYLEACAKQSETVPVETHQPVNKLENLPLKMFGGWGGQ
jgi:hypothetical protein